MNVFHSPNSAPNSKHILPTASDVPLNGTDTFISDNSQTIMTRLNNSTDSHANSSSSVPFCNSPTELFINVSSSCPPRLTTTTKKTMYVRALFDYDPNMDTGLPGRGLPFQHGDILHVVNASDREWWQAKRISLVSDFENAAHVNSMHSTTDNTNNNTINSNTQTSTLLSSTTGLGIVPSCQRIERRQRTRLKRVNFVGKVTVIGSTSYPHTTSINNTKDSNTSSCVSNSGIMNQSPWDIGNNDFATNNNNNCATTTTYSNNMSVDAGISSNSSETLRNNSLDMNIRNNTPMDMPIVSNSTGTDTKKKRSGSLTRNLLKCFSHRSIKNDPIGALTVTRTGSLDGVNQNRHPIIRSYDLVVPVTISMARPLIFFGPLKDRIIDELLLHDSQFTTCVLHTNRPQRSNERNGVDYYFVPSKSIMEEDIKQGKYIEVNRFQDHYYGTSLESVRSILQSGRICILDVGLDAAKYLEEVGLFPITILLKPKSVIHLRSLQRRLTEDQAKRSMEQIHNIEDENWRFLSAIITYENFDNVLLSVKNYVQLHSGPVIWVPSALSTLPGVQCLTSTPKINYHSIVTDPINHPQHNVNNININTNTTTNDNNISALQSLSIQSVNSTQ
ncbi:unnamed protein product [Schistosoma mattheei]|uniref:Guanylate kinase-like domain-containing protein n=2 Tax=Schistosoma mattheei TaxID=31246 RepID=A0AA85B2D5_9TREM|nr:unnamed protein product [Schistosoma mattheei]